MNTSQKQEAKNLFFQQGLNKSQIADKLGISRSYFHFFTQQNDWERLKLSAQHLPSMLAENCYYILGHLMRSVLSENRVTDPAKKQEVDTMHKLALTIGKLKNHTTINENMETFTLFLELMHNAAPGLAKEVAPFVEQFIHARAGIYMNTLQSDKFNHLGYLKTEEKDYNEVRLDGQDIMEWTTRDMPVMNVEDLAAMSKPGATNHAQETDPHYTPPAEKPTNDNAAATPAPVAHDEDAPASQPEAASEPVPAPALAVPTTVQSADQVVINVSERPETSNWLAQDTYVINLDTVHDDWDHPFPFPLPAPKTIEQFRIYAEHERKFYEARPHLTNPNLPGTVDQSLRENQTMAA